MNVALHVPDASSVTAKVAVGPVADEGAIIAMPAHVSLSRNAPLYPVSWTRTFCAFEGPSP